MEKKHLQSKLRRFAKVFSAGGLCARLFATGFFLFSAIFTYPVFADEIISTDTVWTRENSPYSISSGIIISPGSKLTIEQGTEVVVTDGGRILVLGSLYVIGSSTEKVVFRDTDTATTSQRRIDIYVDGSEGGGTVNISGMDLLRPVRIYSQDGIVSVDDSHFKDLGMYISGGSATVYNSHFDSANDLYFTDTDVDFTKVTIDKGKRIYITEASDFSFNNSVLKNTSDIVGSVAVFGDSSVKINSSTIENYVNSGIFADEDSDVTVTGSIIRGGKKGIENIRAHVYARGSSITNNSEYGAIARNTDYPIDAVGNYWGDKSGPLNPDSNPSGLGNAVSHYVDYAPWLEYDPVVCCSSVLFLPGFQSSRLYTKTNVLGFETENRLWEPSGSGDAELMSFSVIGQSVYDVYTKPGDILSEVFQPLPGPNLYKSFFSDLNGLKSSGLIADWAPVSYDWRFSVDDVVERGIIQELQYLAAHSYTGRVTIVAHSNGGLVTKSLMRKLESMNLERLIDKIIFVAVPQIGTPKAIGSLLHGFKEGIPFLFSAVAARKLGENLPGAYGLLPSKSSVLPSPFIIFDSASTLPWIVNGRNIFGRQINSVADLDDFLKGSDGRFAPAESDLTNPSVLNHNLLNSADSIHSDIDNWLPPIGVRLFEIAGWGLDTVSGIKYHDGTVRKKRVLSYTPIMTSSGDGTVVSWSALAMPIADNIEEYVIDLRAANKGFGINRAHADILEAVPLRELLKNLLGKNPEPIPNSGYVFAGPEGGEILGLSPADKTTQIIVHSSGENIINAHDQYGNQTGVSAATGLPENNIIGASYQELGDVTYISVPNNNPATVIVSGGGNGSVTIDVIQSTGSGENASATQDEKVTFTDIEVSTSTVITIPPNDSATSSATSSSPVLEIDDDGDGSIDREVSPDDREEVVTGSEVVVGDDASNTSGGSRSGGRRDVFAIATTTTNIPNDFLVIIDEPASELVLESIHETADVPVSALATASAPIQTQNQTASVFRAAEKLLVRIKTHFMSWFLRFCRS